MINFLTIKLLNTIPTPKFMKHKFSDKDIGKIVNLELDPFQDPIAKALGADKMGVTGTILALQTTHVIMELYRKIPQGYSTRQKYKKNIPYTDILNYSFERKKVKKFIL